MGDIIPEHCMNDPQFRQILEAALNSEIKTAEKTLTELEADIEANKKSFFKDYEFRQQSKQQMKNLKVQNAVLEQALERLVYLESEQTGEISLLKDRVDDATLRARTLQNKQLDELKALKAAWAKHEIEYEKFPLAIKRKNAKNEFAKLKVQLMMKQYKKAEYLQMLKQREKIYQIQIRSAIVQFSEIVLKRWKSQEYTSELFVTIKNLQSQLKEVSQQYEKIGKQLEYEAKAKAVARQQMPPPKLNRSLMQSLYVSRSSKPSEPPEQHISSSQRAVDPDNISIDSRMFDEICDREKYRSSGGTSSTDDQQQNDSAEVSSPQTETASSNDKQQNNNTLVTPEEAMETLESVCRQLSIDGECDDPDHRSQETIVDNDPLPISKSQQDYRSSQPGKSCEEAINPLKKHLSISSEISIKNEGQSENKRAKLARESSNVSLTSNNSNLTVMSINQQKDDNSQRVKSRELPQVKGIETITRPINVITTSKPPSPEVPPIRSELFSPRYAPSYASYDSNFNDEQASIIRGMTNYSQIDLPANWQNMSPPAGSISSFASSCVRPKKTAADNLATAAAQPDNVGESNSNFFSFFAAGPSNTKSLF